MVNKTKNNKKLDAIQSLVSQVIQARTKKNISQKILAKLVDTGQSAISRLESGIYNPTFSFVQKLATALETDIIITFSK